MKNHRLESFKKMFFISASLNALLVFFLFYWILREQPPTPYFELKPAAVEERQTPLASSHNNAQIILKFRKLALGELVAKLSDKELVENGYTQRDLSLACMVAAHYFDLDRALLTQNQVIQKRTLIYGKLKDGRDAQITVYPGLADEQFDAIIQFANRESWPLTSKGIYRVLKGRIIQQESPESTLLDAFYLSSEFIAVERLFSRSEVKLSREELLKMLSEGDFALLSTFAEQQRVTQDFSPARRQSFLLSYIERGSKSASYAMLKTDADFAAKKLDDAHAMTMLKLLSKKSPEAVKFTEDLLASPRSDDVLKLAARRLYTYDGKLKPTKKEERVAITRFVQHPIAVVRAPTPQIVKKAASQYLSYIIQEGDNLWKIARKHKVDVEKLKKLNQLKSDNLKVGKTLKIPN